MACVARLQLQGDVQELLAAAREKLVAGQSIVTGCAGGRILTRPAAAHCTGIVFDYG